MQASVVAEKAAKSIADIQLDEDSESSKEEEAEGSPTEKESDDENEKLRKSALDNLQKASDDSFLGQASLFTYFGVLKLCLPVLAAQMWDDGNCAGFAFSSVFQSMCFISADTSMCTDSHVISL